MADHPDIEASAKPVAASIEASSLRDQLATIKLALGTSPIRKHLLWACVGIVAVIVATSIGQVLLNRWNEPFYDALARRDMQGFLHQLLVFAAIAGGLVVLNVGQTWLDQRIRLKLREALTLDLIGEWMRPARAFRLANAGAIGVNPDQRLQQDAGHLSDLSTGLGIGLLQSLILLVSFVGVLWSLSSGFVFHIGGYSLAIPGYMVWAAILYAGTASWLSWLVGRPLIRFNSDRYTREAELRSSVVRVNENVDAIALAHGEADARRRLELDLGTVLGAMRRIYSAQINLSWVTDTYGWITVVAPILVASPVYFAGDISFGGLMMAVGAFNQVHASLRWFINNIGGIADWRATLMRVADFRIALAETDVLHDTEKRIKIGENPNGRLTFENLEVASRDGCTKLAKPHVEIRAGERVMITGDPRAGKTLFFRAIAGLWPWGSGRIGMPAGEVPAFVPRKPYFPLGTLREVLNHADAAVSDAEISAVLAEVGLGRLSSSLDRSARWERELSDDEQRLLAFARLVLRQPKWVIIDEALDTFDGATLSRVLSMLEARLADAAILNIGRSQQNIEFFPRSLAIVKDVDRPPLKPVRIRAGAIEPPPAVAAAYQET
ncbi:MULTISPECIES: ABC transporter ATP-binding protein/permease [unclassified Mesorhizobium]|uniref:ABC transporter ATP-binding protein/permease n=1 Tax=unclassified Mesorhizobium TaxID=325217 RepID=UPI000FD439FA|nr:MULTISPECIES: ABC transporter ATP-binding protein/permease [unclassified Mesorhizobium]RUV32593.1 ABC transporter ATP-binding protein/permease [Mesorhizobium sp. M5C.F.Ca.IN.020.32.2.1]RWG48015.1 MAG: ABC transporter ATP-binding protein/permease [Mesorhizobium sp.]RWH44173.1 MAG: ABC transporter ATP-binding protein/permease [Mesorhizobium sp.]RWH55998.1 MAG: ABC transporter ATP-binding protein/permease [Mesorhizobium sp.]RWI74692.1 MAG: ABC transporter ATP-binding protein/permease [Mesorhiz